MGDCKIGQPACLISIRACPLAACLLRVVESEVEKSLLAFTVRSSSSNTPFDLSEKGEMYHPTRGGTRGGQAEFTWDQVRADQHRENYLGHSVFAPTGRWQNNKDVNWYNKDKDDAADKEAAAEKRRKELIEVKMREEEEMNKRLGIKPGQMMPSAPSVGDALLRGSVQDSLSSRAGTGSNRAPLDASKSRWNTGKEADKPGEKLSKEDRRAARHLAKVQVREERRKRRKEEGHSSHRRHDHSDDEEGRRTRREVGRRDYNDGKDRSSREDSRYANGRRYEEDERDRRRPRDYRRENDAPPRKNGRDRSRSPGRSRTPEMRHRRRKD